MPLGGLNPFPCQLGGGPTEAEKVYGQIRRAVGEGGSARDDSGIDGLWRMSRAKALAAISSGKRRALLQSAPEYATDLLPYFERVLALNAAPGESETDRRNAVVPLWYGKLGADIPRLSEDLAAIDTRLAILDPSYATSTISHYGRVMEELDPSLGTAFGLGGFSRAPNYSTEFVLRVVFSVGYGGALTAADARIFERVKGFLRDVLPSWVDFSVITSVGFILNESPLDLTGLGA